MSLVNVERIENETEIDDNMYESGYHQALKDINTEMQMITEDWEPSKCPRCSHNFYDYEDCDDGYYHRAYGLERCPFCGQKIKWS